ncbi:MAG: phage tail tape measure protein [Caulobacter sp.]|nr:phage tail tape measure protein [Caulobacter sp.]
MDKDLRLRILLEAVDKAVAPIKAVDKASEALGKKLKATTTELVDLKRAQSDLTKLQRLEKETVDLGLKTTEARRRVAELRSEISASKAPSEKLQAALAKARRTVDDLERSQKQHAGTLGQVRDRLQAAGVELGDMAGAEQRLAAKIKATTATLDGQRRSLKDLATHRARVAAGKEMFGKWGGRAAGAAAAGVGLGASAGAMGRPLFEFGQDAAEFNTVMTTIAQKADLGRAASAAMGDQLLVIADRVNQLPEDVQAATDILAGFGLDPRVAVKLTEPIGKVATAYKADMADVGAATFSSIDNLKLPADQAARALDIMAYSGKRGAFELKDMAAAFPSLTASAQALGQRGAPAVADLAAALQIVRKGAGNSEEAATNLDNLLQKIGSPQTAKNFAKMGVNLEAEMKKAAKAGKTPIEAITTLTNKALKGDLGRLGYLFEDAQVQKAMRPLIQNYQEYLDIRRDAANAKGVVDADFADRMIDDAEGMRKFNVEMAQTKIALGNTLLPILTPLIAKVGAAAKNFGAWTKEHPKLAGALGKIAVIGALIIGVLGAIALVVAPILIVIGAVGSAAAALGVSVGAVVGTIAAIIAAIVAVVFAVIGLVKGWHKLAPIAGAAFQAVQERVVGFLSAFIRLHVLFFQAGAHLMSGLVGGIRSALGLVKDTIVNAGSSVIGWFKAKLGIHSPSRVFAALGGHMMSGLSNGLQAGSKGPMMKVGQIADRLVAGAAMGAAAMTVSAAGPGAAAAPAGSGALPAGGGPARYEIHIHAAPGMDEEALARLVGRVIDRRERARAAAGRSSLADRGD